MRFEWDENKRINNIRKHGLDFESAKEIFTHPRFARLDTRFDYEEDRWISIGLAINRIVVVYLEYDDGDTSDIPPLDDDFFAAAELRIPQPKQTITIRLDANVLDWFKLQGKGYQTRINAVLRMYKEAKMA